MKFQFILVTFILINLISNIYCQKYKKPKEESSNEDDDEFAEFDEFDDSSNVKVKDGKKETAKKEPKKEEFAQFDEDVIIEGELEDEGVEQKLPKQPEVPLKDQKVNYKSQQQQFTDQDLLDSEEFENFVDEEEFEGFERSPSTSNEDSSNSKKKEPDLKIANVPQHLMNVNAWSNYYWELILIAGLVIYVINIFIGKQKNYKLANAYFHAHRDLLEKNFVLIGDDGTSAEIPKESTLIKECENVYGIWCSGRQSCKSMYIQLNFIKRQDLISQIRCLFKAQSDQIVFSVEFDKDDLDSYVFCLTNRKQAQAIQKDYQDIANYCVEKKSVEKFGLDSNKYVLLNELTEVPNMILDTRVCSFLNKYTDLLEYIIVSDQHVGLKTTTQGESETTAQTPAVDTQAELDVGLPNSTSKMILCFNISGKGNTQLDDVERLQPTLLLAFYLIDKISRLRVSKEAKLKAMKKRKDVMEAYLKITNKQRQEAAQLRKEEKRRADKERIMNESDPEKQKRLEEKELKREKRKQASKFKQIKIKSM